VNPAEPRGPKKIGALLTQWLERSGLAPRVAQVRVLDEWPEIVGARIAAVTRAVSVHRDGALVVEVTTHAWMQELSLMEPELLRHLHERPAGANVTNIRWRLKR
jgi:predicted nucleic acid-binding Zn ribbon protein